jgi:multicomponent Na+:H+ antiporter subunit E
MSEEFAMIYFLINICLALLWAALHLFRPVDFAGGFLVGYALIWLTRDWLGEDAHRYTRRVPTFARFLIYYFRELLVSTWEVTQALFSHQATLKPGIIALPLTAKTDLEIVLLNNLLIFTPGTLGVHLSEDRSILYVHIINVPDADAARQKIKSGLERRLLEVLR